MNVNAMLKERQAEIQSQLESEKGWWESKRAGIQSEFMKELDEDTKPANAVSQKKAGSDDDAVLVENDVPAQAYGGKKKKGNK